jgi:hypothetical protein
MPFVLSLMAVAYAIPRFPAPTIRKRGGASEKGGRSGAGRRTNVGSTVEVLLSPMVERAAEGERQAVVEGMEGGGGREQRLL